MNQGKERAEYNGVLRKIWQEIDYYEDFQADCAFNANKYKEKIDKLRIFRFWVGLNQEYDQIRVQILGREPFLSLMQVYATVHSEESRRNIILYAHFTDAAEDGSLLSDGNTKASLKKYKALGGWWHA